MSITDMLLALLPQYGLWMLLATTLMSCLALPVPASLLMVTAGVYAAIGDWGLPLAIGVSLLGAILGDQLGYHIGRLGGRKLIHSGQPHSKRKRLIARARVLTHRYGVFGVFLSRWLVSPLGPYVNLMAGATHYTWWRFSLWAALGEVVWTTMYVSLGFVFAQQTTQLMDMIAVISNAILWLVVALALGRFLWWRIQRMEVLRRRYHQAADSIANSRKQMQSMLRRD